MSTQAVSGNNGISQVELDKARKYLQREEAKGNKKDFSINTTQVQGGIDGYTKGISLNNLNEVGDLRGENQSGYEQLFNGILKNTVKTGLRVGEGIISTPLILAGVLGSALTAGMDKAPKYVPTLAGMINNPISLAMDEAIKGMDRALPNFKTQEQQDSFLENISSVNFWADTALDGVSYAASSYFSGKLVAGGIGLAMKQASKKVLLSNAESLIATEATGLLDNAVKKTSFGQKVLNNAQSIAASLVASVSESGAEARGTYGAVKAAKEAQILARKQAAGDYSDLSDAELEEAKEQAIWAGNASFGLNLGMTGGATYVQMGKLFSSRYKNDALNIDRIVGKAGEAKVSELGKIGKYFLPESKTLQAIAKANNRLTPFYDNVVTEAAQEGGQTFTDKFLTDYFTQDERNVDRFSSSFNNALHDTFQTKEGWESMFLGALIGGGSMALKNFSGNGNDYQKDEKRLAEATKLLNEAGVSMKPTIKTMYDSFSKSTDLNEGKNAAIRDNDKFAYKTLDNADIFNIVNAHLETGRMEELTTQIEGIKDMSDEEFKDAYEITSDTINKDRFAEGLLKKVDSMRGTLENLKVNYNHRLEPEQIKRLSLIAAMKEDFSERETSIIESLKEEYGFDYNENIIEKRMGGSDLGERADVIKKEQAKANKLISSLKKEKIILRSIKDVEERKTQEAKIATITSELNSRKQDITTLSTFINEAITDKDYLKSLNKLTASIRNEFSTDSLREVRQGIEDPTKRQEFDTLLKDLKTIEKHKDYVINAYNRMVDPESYKEEFERINNSILKAKENRTSKEAFTIFSGEVETKLDPETGKQVKTNKRKPIVLENGLYTGVITMNSYEQYKASEKDKAGKTRPAYNLGKDTILVDTPNNLIDIKEKRIDSEGKGEVLVSFNGEPAVWKSVNSLKFKELKPVTEGAFSEEEAFYFKYKDRLITMSIEEGYTLEEALLIKKQNLEAFSKDKKKGRKFTHSAYGAPVSVKEYKGYLGIDKTGRVSFRVLGEDGTFTELQQTYLTKPRLVKNADGVTTLVQSNFPYTFKVNQKFSVENPRSIQSQVKQIDEYDPYNKELFEMGALRQLAKLKAKIGKLANEEGEEGRLVTSIKESMKELEEVKLQLNELVNKTNEQLEKFTGSPEQSLPPLLKILYAQTKRLQDKIDEINEKITFNTLLYKRAVEDLTYIEEEMELGISPIFLISDRDELQKKVEKVTDTVLAEIRTLVAQGEAEYNQSKEAIKQLETKKEELESIIYNDLYATLDLDLEEIQELMSTVGYDAMVTERELKDFVLQNFEFIAEQLNLTIDPSEFFDTLNNVEEQIENLKNNAYENYEKLLNDQKAIVKLDYQKLNPDSPLNQDGIPEDIDTLKMLNNLVKEYETIKEYAMRDMRRSVTIAQMEANSKYGQPFNFKEDEESEDGTTLVQEDFVVRPAVFHNGTITSQTEPNQIFRPFLKTVGLVRDSYVLLTGADGNTPKQKKIKGEYIYNGLVTAINAENIAIEYVTELPNDYEANSEESIYTIVTDLEGNRLYFNINGTLVKEGTQDSYLAISTLSAPSLTYAGGAERFNDLAEIDAGLMEQSLNAYKTYLDAIRAKLNSGKKHFVQASGKSFGIRNTDEEKKGLDVITRLNLTDTGKEKTQTDGRIIVATSSKTTIGTTVYRTTPGFTYYIDANNGKVIPLDSRTLSDLEVDTVINSIIYYHNQEDASATSQLKQQDLLNNTLGKLLLWGKEKTGKKKRSYQIYFKPGSNDTTVVYGLVENGTFKQKEITLNQLMLGEDTDFKQFLKERKLQVSKSNLNKSTLELEEKKNQFLAKNLAKGIEGLTPQQTAIVRNTNKFYITYYPTPQSYKVENFETYEQYLARGNKNVDSVVRSNMVRGLINTETSTVIPQWSNSYLRLNPEEYTPVKKTVLQETVSNTMATAMGAGKAVNMSGATRGNTFASSVIGDNAAAPAAPATPGNTFASSVLPTSVSGTPATLPIPDAAIEKLEDANTMFGIIEPEDDEYSAFDMDAGDEFNPPPPISGGSPMTFTTDGDKEPKYNGSQLESALNRLQKKYPSLNISKVAGLINGKHFGLFTRAGQVLLSDLAPIGTDFHEEFHIVEQLYLGENELKALYERYRATKPGETLSDKQVSELLAEEFRYYAINRVAETANVGLKNYLQKFFKELYDFIKNIVSLQKDTQINQLFSDIYTGVYAAKNGLSTNPSLTTGEVNQINNYLKAAIPFWLNKKIPLLTYYGAPRQREKADKAISDFFVKQGYAEYFPEAKTTLERIAFIAIQHQYTKEAGIPNELKIKMGVNFRAIIAGFKAEDDKRNSIFTELIDEEEDNKLNKDSSHLYNSNETDYAGKPIEVVRQMLNSILTNKFTSLGFEEGVDADKYVRKLMYDMQEVESLEEVYKILSEGDVVYIKLLDMFKQSNVHFPNLNANDRVSYINTRNKFLKQMAMSHLEYTTNILDYNTIDGFTKRFTFKKVVENKMANSKSAKALFESDVNIHLAKVRKESNNGISVNPFYQIAIAPETNAIFARLNTKAVADYFLNVPDLLSIGKIFNGLSMLGIDFNHVSITKRPDENGEESYSEQDIKQVLLDNDIDVAKLRMNLTNFINFYVAINGVDSKGKNLNPFNIEVFNKLSSSISSITDLQRAFSGNNLNFSLLNSTGKTSFAFQKQSTLSKKIKRIKEKRLKLNPKLTVISGLKKSKTNRGVTEYEDGNTANDLTASEMFLTFFNTIMGGGKDKSTTVPYIFPGSKSMTYGIQGFNTLQYNINPIETIVNLLKAELESIIEAKKEYAESEFVITNRHVRGNEGNLKIGEGMKLSTMSGIFKDEELLFFFDGITDGLTPMEEIDKLVASKTGVLVNSINQYLATERQAYLQFMQKEGIILNLANEIVINGIDGDILDHGYVEKNYNLSQTNVKSEETMNNINLLLNDFILTSMVNLSEQLNYLTGEANYFKDPLKRFTGLMGTRSNIHIGEEFLQDYNEHLINKDSPWNSEQYPMGNTARVLVINDRVIPDYGKMDYIREEFLKRNKNADNAISSYFENNIADGQSYESLDFFRFREIAEGIWGEGAKEAIYNKLIGSNANTVTKDELEFLLNQGAYLNTSKTQAFTEFSKFNGGKMHPMFIKTSVFIPNLVKGTALESLGNFMNKNGLAMVMYESAVKVGRVVSKTTNSGLNAFDVNGMFDEDALAGFENYVQNIDLAYYGTQVDTNPKPKEKTTVGSQERKMILSNIYRVIEGKEGGSPEYDEAVAWMFTTIDKINNLEILKAKASMVELKEKLGIKEDADGNYFFENKKELISALTEEARIRDLPVSFTNDINYLLNNNYSLDVMARKAKLESVLLALVGKGVIRTKVKGDAKAQVSSSGFTAFFEKENIIEDLEDKYKLDFYPTDVENNKDFVMEVYLPSYLEGKVNINSIINLNYDPNSPERLNPLLQVLGFRIPTQGLNSIEAIRIKGFLPAHMGNTIVVPYQITAKSGSDFDIDKLNLYFPAFYVNNEGESVYIKPYIDEDKSEKEYENYIKGVDEEVIGLNGETDRLSNTNKTKVKRYTYSAYRKLAIDNAILATHLDIFQRPENRLEILTPNTEYNLKGVAKGQDNAEYPYKESVRGLRGILPNESKTNLLSILYLVKKKISFEIGKGVLGQFALHSTHHILSQMAFLKVNPEVFANNVPYFEAYRESGLYGELDLIYDVRGNLISKNIEQPGNAAVDVEKDDYLLDINIASETVAVYGYLLRLGIPLEEASYFLAQPAISMYLDTYYRLIADNTKRISKTAAEGDALELVESFYAGAKMTMPFITIRSLKEGIRGGFTGKEPTIEHKAFQRLILTEFIKHKSIAETLNSLMGITNQDTASVSTSLVGNDLNKIKEDTFRKDVGKGTNLRDRVAVSTNLPEGTLRVNTATADAPTQIPVLLGVENFFSFNGKQTYLGYFREVIREANDFFNPLFLINNWSERLGRVSGIVQGVSKAFASTDDKINTLNVIKNELLTFIVVNMDKDTIASRSKALLTGKDSVAIKLLNYQKAGINNYLINELRPIIPNDLDKDLHDIYLYDANNTSPARNDMLVEGFHEMYDVDPVFTLDLISQSILQSGFNNSPTTIHNIIPADLLLKVVESFYLNPSIPLDSFEEQLVTHNSNRDLLFGNLIYDRGIAGFRASDESFLYYKGNVKVGEGEMAYTKKAVFKKAVDVGTRAIFEEQGNMKGFSKSSSVRSYKVTSTNTEVQPVSDLMPLTERVKQCIF